MRFEELVSLLGDFGTYQKRVFVLVFNTSILSAFHKLVWAFLGAVPPHRCRIPADDAYNQSSIYSLPDDILNVSIPWDAKNEQWNRCEMYNLSNTIANNTETIYCNEWVYDTSQYTLTVVTEFNLVCYRNWLRAMAYSLYIVGEFFGATVIGYISDRFGRRRVMLICLFGQGITGLAAGLVHNYYAFLVLRIFVAMFTQAGTLAGFVLAMEFIGSSKRAIAGIARCYFFASGYVFITGIAFLLRKWFYLQIAISVPVLMYFFVYLRWLPESARWLLSVNKNKEAMVIVERAARVNKVELPPEIINKMTTDPNVEIPQITLLEIIRSGIMRKLLILMGYIWLVNNAVYYGLALNTSNLGGNDYLNFLFGALVEFPAYALCLFCTARFGRRWPAFFSMAIGGLALLCIVFVPIGLRAVNITLAMIGKFGISMSYAIIYVMSTELYPTQMRNAGLGINSTCSRIGSTITPFILLLADFWRPLPLIVLGGMSVSAGLLMMFLPETHNAALPETMNDMKTMMNQSKKVASATTSLQPSGNNQADTIRMSSMSIHNKDREEIHTTF